MRVEHTGAESLPRCLFLYPFAVKFRALPVRCTNFGEVSQDLDTVKGTAVSLGQLAVFLSSLSRLYFGCLEQTRVHFLIREAIWQIMVHIHIARPFLTGKIRIIQTADWGQSVVHIILWTLIRHGLREFWLAEAKTMYILCSCSIRNGSPCFDSLQITVAWQRKQVNQISFSSLICGRQPQRGMGRMCTRELGLGWVRLHSLPSER